MSVIKKELEATWNHKPFKNREEVRTEIRDCDRFGGISQYACFIFAALGIIGDALNTTRIQGATNVRNKASQRVLEKAGFRIEGTCRKSSIVRGVWTDSHLYSILREEWKEPKILTKTA
jgi:hypothetical protein